MNSMIWLCLFIGCILLLLLLFILLCFIYRKTFIRSQNKFCKLFHPNHSNEKKTNSLEDEQKDLLLSNEDKQILFQDLIIGNLLKQGRFSAIHPGIYNHQPVAIKILTDFNQINEGKNLFINEKDIYSLPFMEHFNILK